VVFHLLVGLVPCLGEDHGSLDGQEVGLSSLEVGHLDLGEVLYSRDGLEVVLSFVVVHLVLLGLEVLSISRVLGLLVLLGHLVQVLLVSAIRFPWLEVRSFYPGNQL